LQRWSYDLHSTLHRELVKSRVPLEQWRNRDRAALTMFQRLTRERLPGWHPPQDDVLTWTATMQHYRAPTRLTDWSPMRRSRRGKGPGALTLLLAPEEALHGAPRALARLARRLHTALPEGSHARRHPAEAYPEALRHGGCQPRGEGLVQGELGIVDVPFQHEVDDDLIVPVLQGGYHGFTGHAHEGAERALGRRQLQPRDRELSARH